MFTCEHCGNKQNVVDFFGDYWICDNCNGCNDSIEEIRQDIDFSISKENNAIKKIEERSL